MTIPSLPEDHRGEWFVRLPVSGRASIQAFVFPHAGGGCATFMPCAVRLSGLVELWGLNLPGRQARFLERPLTEIGTLVGLLTDALVKHRDGRPYALIGYCGGALLAYLVAAELQRHCDKPPERLIVVSFAAPHRVRVDPALISAPPVEFWERIKALGGVHDVLAADPDAQEIFEAPVRADYLLLAGYKYRDLPPLASPITVVAGQEDPLLSTEELAEWSGYCLAGSRLVLVPGGHWLLEDDSQHLAGALAEELTRGFGGDDWAGRAFP